MNEWVDVEDSLPDEGEAVLIATTYGAYDVCELSYTSYGIQWVNHMRRQHANGSVKYWMRFHPSPNVAFAVASAKGES
jgi:hypothetical protein